MLSVEVVIEGQCHFMFVSNITTWLKTETFWDKKLHVDILFRFEYFCSYGPQILSLSARSNASEDTGPLWKSVKTQQVKPALNKSGFLFLW